MVLQCSTHQGQVFLPLITRKMTQNAKMFYSGGVQTIGNTPLLQTEKKKKSCCILYYTVYGTFNWP